MVCIAGASLRENYCCDPVAGRPLDEPLVEVELGSELLMFSVSKTDIP
jgi:hypothetical protein